MNRNEEGRMKRQEVMPDIRIPRPTRNGNSDTAGNYSAIRLTAISAF